MKQIKKKTKIIATISNKNCEPEFIKRLFDEGMNIVRLNTAHQSTEDAEKVIINIRKVSENIAIIIDTKGPEVRTTNSLKSFNVAQNDIIYIDGKNTADNTGKGFSVNYKNYVNDVSIGKRILIDDGEVSFEVIDKKDNKLICRVENSGIIEKNKSVNTPSVKINLPSLSKKDLEFIDFAIENNIDFIAHSFVRKKEDLIAIQNILDKKDSRVKLIAKIENREGVDNIDEIIEHSYGIMVARGDLAIEIPQSKIPNIQKQITAKCIEKRKPVIIATQMLHTMIKNPRPTRAEVSDVANAIYDQTDAIMLSGETAYGKYPIEAVKVMVDIALEIESVKNLYHDIPRVIVNNEITAYLAKSAVIASAELSTKAIIADSASGRTIRSLAAYRSQNIVHAMCYDKRVMRELALTYGVQSHFIKLLSTSDAFICKSLQKLQEKSLLKNSDLVIILAGNFGPTNGTSFIEISSVENLLTKCDK